ncbi:MAG: hypothetical protein HKN96_08830 [Flavobacteriaceae bacterium]|nr:hypothetical protein [Flavobacteriaceae bacterium]
MEEDNLKSLFEDLREGFDFENPKLGHQQRFLAKLQEQRDGYGHEAFNTNYKWWKPLMGVAASVALIVSVLLVVQPGSSSKDLASVSPEMSQTQDYFTVAITEELNRLESERSPETEAMVDDALSRMSILEDEYEELKKDLTESGDDQRVIYAMIANFQNRIDLLKSVLENIENVKLIKQDSNENSITI